MVAGLTGAEELNLAIAANRRYRAALDIAIHGLASARDCGYQDASLVMADVNAVLTHRPVAHMSPPLWPRIFAWLKR